MAESSSSKNVRKLLSKIYKLFHSLSNDSRGKLSEANCKCFVKFVRVSTRCFSGSFSEVKSSYKISFKCIEIVSSVAISVGVFSWRTIVSIRNGLTLVTLFAHDDKASCNCMTERIPKRLPLANDGSNRRRNRFDKELRFVVSSEFLLDSRAT